MGDIAGVAGAIIGLLALAFAVFVLRRSNQNASAANLIAINEGLRQAWARFFQKNLEIEARKYEFADLCNILEVACVILEDNAVFGHARKLLNQMLKNQIDLIRGNEAAKKEMEALQQDLFTFEYLKRFMNRNP